MADREIIAIARGRDINIQSDDVPWGHDGRHQEEGQYLVSEDKKRSTTKWLLGRDCDWL